MTYREYSDHLKVCRYLGKESSGKFKKIHDFLTGFWDGMEVVLVLGQQDERIVLLKGGQWYFGRDPEDVLLWKDSVLSWSLYKNEPGMGYDEFSDFMTEALDERPGCGRGRVMESFRDWRLNSERHIICPVGVP